MAASQSDQNHQLKKESGQASSDGNDHSPAENSPATGYPPTMGYHPSMGYPLGQSGYPPPGYNNGYNNHYLYAQAPPAGYYNPDMYQPQPGYRASGFVRGIVGGLVFFIIFICISTIIIWLILRPAIPIFHVDTFTVSNFNASSSSFEANWDANITVKNPNTKLKAYFDQVEVNVYYEDNLLAKSFANPFQLETKQDTVMQAKLASDNSDHSQTGVGSRVVERMTEDRNSSNRKLSFNLRVALWTTFKSGTWWARHINVRVYCENLEVGFVGNTSDGKLSNDKTSDCLVFA
ncbi:hypothetical protein P3X46_009446 [Hevea brasiliensis]|uniref:Late embryogenesis abundant protein LEA-2 subgroup domain-containing protein n=1 Tax=Hevea brasiliensis TaxID=3981 RepID=A0ABQ9MLV9_HEVBR|nr:NDR1/HIN1-like protein 10 [Hevea brasiliensis]KAJ9181306.1 hypothetical protein P3X46_009446 [Hevea brasiliensis]